MAMAHQKLQRSISGLAGISLGQSGNLFSPELYSEIASSSTFYRDLVNRRFYFKSVGDSLPLSALLGIVAALAAVFISKWLSVFRK